MPHIENPADGTGIFFDDDRGEGETLVFLHGSALSRSIWRGLGYVKAFAERHRTVRIDLRGHGKSDKPHAAADYNMPAIVSDVIAVLDALELDRVHLIGYSFGARVGLAMAAAAGQRLSGLTMLGGTYTIESGELGSLFFDGYLQVLRAGDIEGFVAGLEHRRTLDPVTRLAFLSNDPLALAAYFEAAERTAEVSAETLAGIRTPTLLMAGTLDQPRFEHNKTMSRIMPDARLVPLVGRTHDSTLHPSGPVSDAIDGFVRRAASGRTQMVGP